jgi:hypothetical protein
MAPARNLYNQASLLITRYLVKAEEDGGGSESIQALNSFLNPIPCEWNPEFATRRDLDYSTVDERSFEGRIRRSRTYREPLTARGLYEELVAPRFKREEQLRLASRRNLGNGSNSATRRLDILSEAATPTKPLPLTSQTLNKDLPISVKGKRLNASADTGSDECCMPKVIADHLGLKVRRGPGDIKEFEIGNGTKIKSIGRTTVDCSFWNEPGRKLRCAFYSTTLISGTRGVKNGVKGCPKRHLLHRVDHVTVSRFFLACAVKLWNRVGGTYRFNVKPAIIAGAWCSTTIGIVTATTGVPTFLVTEATWQRYRCNLTPTACWITN